MHSSEFYYFIDFNLTDIVTSCHLSNEEYEWRREEEERWEVQSLLWQGCLDGRND